MTALTAEGISVSYPTRHGVKQVLAPLSLQLEKGESVVILGPSGCGKSTLLNVLAGFQPPDQGVIRLDGQVLKRPGGERGVVFQDDALMPWLSARENVALGLKVRGQGRAQRNQRADRMLALVGLSQFASQRPAALSGGQRQRLGLARALAVEPDFLLLDEPFGALDALTRERMQVLLLKLWRLTGKGIFMITHSIDEALLLATDLMVMSGPPGRIVHHLRPDFAQRFLAGQSPRTLRADPSFAALRQRINDELLGASENGAAQPVAIDSPTDAEQAHGLA